jgi:hypothetical protein
VRGEERYRGEEMGGNVRGEEKHRGEMRVGNMREQFLKYAK